MTIDWNYLFTNTEGRIGRTQYWIGIAVILVLQALSYMLFGGGLVGIVSRLVITLIGLAVMIKRCHDFGQTGWLALISFIPFVGTLWTIALGLIPGHATSNKYGPALNSHASQAGRSSDLTGAPEVRTDAFRPDPDRNTTRDL